MKTYRNEKDGFEIDLPDGWSLHKDRAAPFWNFIFRLFRGWTPHVNVAFTCGPNEILNLVIEPMKPELSPEDTRRLFAHTVQNNRVYSNLEFGRITVGGKSHTWVRYLMFDKVWSKKYMIVLGGNGYAITASCNGYEMFLQREIIWDEIVSSLRLIPSSEE